MGKHVLLTVPCDGFVSEDVMLPVKTEDGTVLSWFTSSEFVTVNERGKIIVAEELKETFEK